MFGYEANYNVENIISIRCRQLIIRRVSDSQCTSDVDINRSGFTPEGIGGSCPEGVESALLVGMGDSHVLGAIQSGSSITKVPLIGGNRALQETDTQSPC